MGEISRFGWSILVCDEFWRANQFCRETIKRLLAFPPDTNMVWKSHDDSIAQRSAIDQARHEKTGSTGLHSNPGKRREPTVEEVEVEKKENVAS